MCIILSTRFRFDCLLLPSAGTSPSPAQVIFSTICRKNHRFEMQAEALFLLFLLILRCCSAQSDRLLRPSLVSQSQNTSATRVFQVKRPLPTDGRAPSCSLTLLRHDFSNTYGSPPASASYSPPANCSAPWSAVVLDFSASCAGEQYNRISAVWFDGIEIFRTSTAEPSEQGIFWSVTKDVTRYASVLKRPNATVYVMLENIVNDIFTGIYHVNLTLSFYEEKTTRVSRQDAPLPFQPRDMIAKWGRKIGRKSKPGSTGSNFADKRSLTLPSEGKDESIRQFSSSKEAAASFLKPERNAGDGLPVDILSLQDMLGFSPSEDRHSRFKTSNLLYKKPADLIIPISTRGSKGFWFQIQNESDVHRKEIKEIPANAFRAVLEICVSHHSNDEYWYSNLPDPYIQKHNLTMPRGNGAFRQVFATLDGLYVGSIVPFPIVFGGGINPLFWEPVPAIGAFDLPSYDLDLTPFLGVLSDGKNHTIGLGVTDAISYWLVNANLHLWLDHRSPSVSAGLVKYRAPELSISTKIKDKKQYSGGKIKIKAKREVSFAGWVNSSFGNFTTHLEYTLKFKNRIDIKEQGDFKEVKLKIRERSRRTLEAYSALVLAKSACSRSYPLHMATLSEPRENNTVFTRTNFSHGWNEESSAVLPWGISFSSLSNSQECEGSMLLQDHSVLSGAAGTVQRYVYRDVDGCYNRTVSARDGQLLEDTWCSVCHRRRQPLEVL